VLTFGASWCKPCKKELPALDKLAIRLEAKERLPVKFIAVNLDDTKAPGQAFMKRLGLRCIWALYDPSGRLGGSYAPPVMPSTYVIGKRGIVRHLHEGYRDGDIAKLEREIRGLL